MQEFAFHVYISSLWLLTWLKHDNLITTKFARRVLQITERISKRRRVFQSEDNHERIIAKRGEVLRNYRFKHELKMTFLFNFYAKQRRLKR